MLVSINEFSLLVINWLRFWESVIDGIRDDGIDRGIFSLGFGWFRYFKLE